MSRMNTRNGGIRNAEGSAVVSQEKSAMTAPSTKASATSALKRTVDLFTEEDKEAIQPGKGGKDAARDLVTAATNGVKPPPPDAPGKVDPAARGSNTASQQEKQDAVNRMATTDDEEEDDSYLSDDPVERQDVMAKGEAAQRIRFATTLLIPVAFKPEVTRVTATLCALFTIWKKDLGMEVQSTTKFQELQDKNKKQYCRLQVTFERARDANFVWRHGIVHTCLDGKTRINLDWQHPVDPAYVKAHAVDPSLVEVLFKGVDAMITPEMLREMLVVVKLVVRGRFAFKKWCCFHRVVNPVTGMDTDKVKGLVKPHEGDKYRWRHLVDDPIDNDKQLLVHYPSHANAVGVSDQRSRLSQDQRSDQARLEGPAEDHNFWSELQPHSMAAVEAPTRAGGVAILCFREDVLVEDIKRHPSGRLLHARIRWGTRQVRLLAVYFPAQAPPHGS
ncbi:unnamed protein product [Closterium sp. Naga37s-1]|nr:unnamed protein product [Closterium sp. Naga37s-1]